MKTILNYHVFSLWVSCSPFRYHSASSLPFRVGSTNMFLPQVTSQSKSRQPPWNYNDRIYCSTIPTAFSLPGMISSSVIAGMVPILQFAMLCLKSCPALQSMSIPLCAIIYLAVQCHTPDIGMAFVLCHTLLVWTYQICSPDWEVQALGGTRNLRPNTAPTASLHTNGSSHILLQAKPSFHSRIGNRADLTISPSALCIQLNSLSLIMAFDCLTLR